MTTRRTRGAGGLAAVVLFTLALLLAATAAYILFVPVDASNFEVTTGVSWDGFSSANPEVADYLVREARLLAVGFLGLTLLTAILAWGPLRRGDSWAGRALWLFPATLLVAAMVFLLSGDPILGGMYVAAGLIAATALAVAVRRPSAGVGS